MSFIADKQTVSDLNLLGKFKPSSVFSLFNQVVTAGGERLLQEMFHEPLSSHAEINRRSSMFRYFQDLDLDFPFLKDDFMLAESYFGMGAPASYPVVMADLVSKKLMGSFLHDLQYDQILSGQAAAIRILKSYRDFLIRQSAEQQKDVSARDAQDQGSKQNCASLIGFEEKNTQEKNGQEKDGQEKNAQEKDGQEKNAQEKHWQEKNAQEQSGQENNAQEENGQEKDGQQKGAALTDFLEKDAQQIYAQAQAAQQKDIKLKNAGQRPVPYFEEADQILAIFSRPELSWLEQEDGNTLLSIVKVAKYHYILQHTLQKEMEQILNSIYELDVYIAVSKTGKSRGFGYATASPRGENLLHMESLWHPGLMKGIANTLSFHQDQNMVFLTGANMAGKSTLMKAFGIAVYLAHMGFPVAAKDMQFSVMDGLFSSINVPDDLNMGYSHFYAEVLRVKQVAREVSAGKNLVVLFDELFKGTNVKDAYDATLSVTRSFSAYRNCFYVISTHIIEVGEALSADTQNLRFAYLPTVMDGKVPRYTYRLQEGITTDRQGMMIIENEGILDILGQGEM